MRVAFALVAVMILVPAATPVSALGQGTYKAEVLKQAPPEELAAPIREALQDQGIRVVDDQGKPILDLWLRKTVPAESEPSGPQGAILYPFLKEGQLIGGMTLHVETGDYRDQPILTGVYTMRYGLQPINGDHLGVSTYRDYLLLSLPDEDTELAPISQQDLEILSTGPSGTNHPAVFLLQPAPENGSQPPSVIHNTQEERWGVVVPLNVTVGENNVTTPIQIIFIGTGPV